MGKRSIHLQVVGAAGIIQTGHSEQLSGAIIQTHMWDTMPETTREEIDAKIAASEARTDTKIARLDGKLDLVISKLDDVRDDGRSTRSNQWVIAFGLAGLMLVIAFGLPTIFSFGTGFRDLVREEVQSMLLKVPLKSP